MAKLTTKIIKFAYTQQVTTYGETLVTLNMVTPVPIGSHIIDIHGNCGTDWSYGPNRDWCGIYLQDATATTSIEVYRTADVTGLSARGSWFAVASGNGDGNVMNTLIDNTTFEVASIKLNSPWSEMSGLTGLVVWYI